MRTAARLLILPAMAAFTAAAAFGFSRSEASETPSQLMLTITPKGPSMIEPLQRLEPDVYVARLDVVDPERKVKFGSVQTEISRGKERSARQSGRFDLELIVALNEAGDEAKAFITVAREGIVLTRQVTRVWLPVPVERPLIEPAPRP